MYGVLQVVGSAVLFWHRGKLFIERAVPIDHDALHVIFGLLAWLVFCAVSSRSIVSWRPFLCTVALILLNEGVDLWTELWPHLGMQLVEGAKDIIMTLVGPTLIILTRLVAPSIFRT